MKLADIKKQLGVNTSSKKLKKIINGITQSDLKRHLKKKKDDSENIFIKIIKSKLS